MLRHFLKRLSVALMAGTVAATVLPAALVAAAPLPPTFVYADGSPTVVAEQNQVGLYNPTNNKWAAGWFRVAFGNPSTATATYTQVSLKVGPAIDPVTKVVKSGVVARLAMNGNTPSGSSDTVTPQPLGTDPVCTRYDASGNATTDQTLGSYFICNWAANLSPGQYVAPIRFIFSDTWTGSQPDAFAIPITANVKSNTTAGGGLNGFTGKSDTSITVNSSNVGDANSTYFFDNVNPLVISTFKTKNGGQATTVTLPPSNSGYQAVLQDFDFGTYPNSPCAGFDQNPIAPGAQISRISVNGGADVSPYLKVVIQVSFDKYTPQPSNTDLAHAYVSWCIDTNSDPTLLYGHVYTIGTAQSGADFGPCTKTNPTAPCWVSGTSKKNGGVTTWTLTVLVPHNGLMKGGF